MEPVAEPMTRVLVPGSGFEARSDENDADRREEDADWEEDAHREEDGVEALGAH